MQRCQECSACLRARPSGAITSERFLLSAERCINFHKERLSDYPEWLDPAWHDCLVGCMHCQRACPQNRGFLDWVEPLGEFSERETAMLLKNVPLGALPVATVQKLRRLDLVGLLDVLPRDLEIFMRRSGQGPR